MSKPMTLIHQASDKLFKQAMADIRVAKEFFATHLPVEILQTVNLETLQLQKNSFIDAAYKAHEADVLYAVKQRQQSAYFYLLCENQSLVDESIAFRLLVYMVRIMEMHLKQYPGSVLPIVYPLVIYTGEKSWHAPLDIFELYGEHKELAKRIWLQPYQLIDVQRVPDAELRQRLWSGLVEFALKHRRVRDLADFLDTLLPWLQQIDILQGSNFAKIVLKYATDGIETKNADVLIAKANQYLSTELRGEIMTLAQEFEQKGMQQGMQQKTKMIAVKMLQEGMIVQAVQRITGLSLAEIQELQQPADVQ